MLMVPDENSPLESSCPLIEAQIQEFLQFYAYEDAQLLSELYYQKVKTDASLLIYVDCLMKAQKMEEVFGLLQDHPKTNPRLRYIFALACFALNKMEDCQSALLDVSTGKLKLMLLESPVASYAHLLLSTIFCDTGRVEEAINESRKAVQANILIWTGVHKYVKFGGVKTATHFAAQKKKVMEERVEVSDDDVYQSTENRTEPSENGQEVKCRRSTRILPSRATSTPLPAVQRKLVKSVDKRTPAVSLLPKQSPTMAPRKSTRITEVSQDTRRTSGRTASQRLAFSSDTENVAQPRSHTSTFASRSAAKTNAAPRSNTRSSENRSPSVRKVRDATKQPLSSRNSNLFRSLSGSANSVSSVASSALTNEEKEKCLEIEQVAAEDEKKRMADEELEEPRRKKLVPAYGDLYKDLFNTYTALALIEEASANYQWSVVGKLLRTLDHEVILIAPIARQMLARVCFEQGEYGEARDILEELRRKWPYRVDGMELLSTAMWHLQESHSLSMLAQQLTTESRNRPQSWCVAGNCFSLQRQHSQAVECLERAIQLDPRFAYAHTLLGHELIVQEGLDRAAACFRTALTLSPRDYRAWHGLGLVHLKKEQNALAQSNMAKAVSINPTNRAMLCTLSQVEMGLCNYKKAMDLVDRALQLNSSDVASRFNRARLLFETKRNVECMKELEMLKEYSPDEAFIFHLLAKVHRRLGNTHKALLNFSWAAELDPRGEQGLSAGVSQQAREDYEEDEYDS